MSTQYTQLTSEERDRIAVLRAQGITVSDIAHTIGRHKSTVSRELRRNRAPIYDVYLPHRADKRAHQRKTRAAQRPRLKDPATRAYVIEKLLLGWSPEQISGRLARDHPGASVSHEAIYQFIYAKDTRREMDLRPCLVRSHRKRLPRGHSRRHRKTHIPERISIRERPQEANERHQPGHWEIDTIISRKSAPALALALERASRCIHLEKLPGKTAKDLRGALTLRLSQHPAHMRRTLTYDNGSENTEHLITNEALGTASYFCEPYHSWEKAAVEHAAGLVRRFLPKKTDFAIITKEHVRDVESLINSRPRKCLHYETPSEAFERCVALPR